MSVFVKPWYLDPLVYIFGYAVLVPLAFFFFSVLLLFDRFFGEVNQE